MMQRNHQFSLPSPFSLLSLPNICLLVTSIYTLCRVIPFFLSPSPPKWIPHFITFYFLHEWLSSSLIPTFVTDQLCDTTSLEQALQGKIYHKEKVIPDLFPGFTDYKIKRKNSSLNVICVLLREFLFYYTTSIPILII